MKLNMKYLWNKEAETVSESTVYLTSFRVHFYQQLWKSALKHLNMDSSEYMKNSLTLNLPIATRQESVYSPEKNT